jgi:Tol biopolymer transport system component
MYAGSGHLLFVRDHTLFAIPFDPETGETSGQPLPVLEDLASSVGDQENDNGSARYDVSPQGTLLYRTWNATSGAMRITYLDGETGITTPLGTEAMHNSMAVSPDGRWLAVARGIGAGSEIYLVDTRTRVERRFAESSGNLSLGMFSRDSRTLYWAGTSGDARWWLLRQPIDGSSPVDSVASIMDTLIPHAVSADGRHVFVAYWSRSSSWNIGRVDLESDAPQVIEFIGGPGDQIHCRPSPDGRWFAYFATESGQPHVYLRRYPDTGAEWQLTREGIDWRGMTWATDSGSLLLCNAVGVHRIRIDESEGTLDIGSVEPLFPADLNVSATSNRGFWPQPDGLGAYLLQPAGDERAAEPQTILITSWLDRLAARFAGQVAASR